MNINEVIHIHLTLQDFINRNGQVLESCLTHALREARIITGRNTETGVAIQPEPEGSYLGRWSGAMVYLSILDQIGKCYKPRETITLNMNPIQKALRYFTTLSPEEIEAIYALRNSLFHDFCLYNRNKTHQLRQHSFVVDNHPTNPVVILPSAQWDGNMHTRSVANQTYINLRALGDLIEDVYQQLITLHNVNSLEITLENGHLEIKDRYIFSHG